MNTPTPTQILANKYAKRPIPQVDDNGKLIYDGTTNTDIFARALYQTTTESPIIRECGPVNTVRQLITLMCECDGKPYNSARYSTWLKLNGAIPAVTIAHLLSLYLKDISKDAKLPVKLAKQIHRDFFPPIFEEDPFKPGITDYLPHLSAAPMHYPDERTKTLKLDYEKGTDLLSRYTRLKLKEYNHAYYRNLFNVGDEVSDEELIERATQVQKNKDASMLKKQSLSSIIHESNIMTNRKSNYSFQNLWYTRTTLPSEIQSYMISVVLPDYIKDNLVGLPTFKNQSLETIEKRVLNFLHMTKGPSV
ncbi:hypothetical protein AB6D11_00315 [Vibrio splendidus]